jgi:hypothetical protein
MKRNIKRLALVVIIAAIPMLIAAVTASAAGKTIQGDYAFTGTGTTLIAILGFNSSLQPNGGPTGPWFISHNLWSGVLSFNKDGTGSHTGFFSVVDVYSSGIGAPPDAGSANVSWDFTYTIDKSGNITFTYVKGSFEQDWTSGPNAPPSPQAKSYVNLAEPWGGTISSDGKIITEFWGPYLAEITSDKANTIPTGVQAMDFAALQGIKIK